MFKITVNYEDFDGNKKMEDLYFNINKAEVYRLGPQLGSDPEAYVKKMDATKDAGMMLKLVDILIDSAYGVKYLDEDGSTRFRKNARDLERFKESNAYAEFFAMLFNPETPLMEEFINKVLPQDFLNQNKIAMEKVQTTALNSGK